MRDGEDNTVYGNSSILDPAERRQELFDIIHAKEQGKLTTSQKDKGSKFDSGKPAITLIPKIAIENEAQVFSYGANKYGKNNWKLGLSYSRLLDASIRHILAFSSKENLDPESGISHLAHARAGLAMLEEFVKNGGGTDDR